jgi:hypothetical protein
MKYELGQEMWFIHNNIIISAKVQARQYRDQFSEAHCLVFDETGTKYHLCNVWLNEDKLFTTKEKLVENMLSQQETQ